MQLTVEQLAIIAEGASGSGNLIVTARAGAAKTTTIVKLAEAIPLSRSGLCLAFNSGIRDELKARMPSNFRAMTLNGCGFDAWRRYIGKPCKVDKDKTYNLVKEACEGLEQHETEQIWENFGELRKAISMGKTCGYIPGTLPAAFRPLTTAGNFYAEVLDFNPTDLEVKLIDAVLEASWNMTRNGVLDFDDMLLAPAVAGVSFPHYDYVLVDEAQDLSMINQVLIKKIARGTTRVIAVGDPCQAIYGFRGADSSSMETLRSMFSAKELFLTTSFRCSRAVCENARWRAPDMCSPDWAEEGVVKKLEAWSPSDVPEGAAIICRNNAPLFSMAIRLLRAGLYPELRGRDIIKGIVSKMKKLGKAKTPKDEAIALVTAWVEKEKKRQRDQRPLEDQADCMRLFINETDTLGSATAFAQALSERAGRIYMMTGHGSKGLEFDHVFFLDQHLLNIKQDQDANVKYVIETRAKKTLTYITSEGYMEDANEEAA